MYISDILRKIQEDFEAAIKETIKGINKLYIKYLIYAIKEIIKQKEA